MKKIVILTFTITLLLVCLAIGACSKSPTPQPQPQPQPQATNKIPDLSGVIFNGATYQYDGTPKSLYVTGLPAGIVAQYNGNDVADAGVHLVTAQLYYDGKLVKNLSAELVIKKAVYDMKGVSFPHVTHAYTGASDNPSIVGKLPDGVTVTYQCDKEIKRTGEELERLLAHLEAENLSDIQPQDVDEEEVLPDPTVYDAMRFLVKELEYDNKIYCPCGDGEYDLRFCKEGIQVYCTKCGATYTFDTRAEAASEDYLALDSIKLT